MGLFLEACGVVFLLAIVAVVVGLAVYAVVKVVRAMNERATRKEATKKAKQEEEEKKKKAAEEQKAKAEKESAERKRSEELRHGPNRIDLDSRLADAPFKFDNVNGYVKDFRISWVKIEDRKYSSIKELLLCESDNIKKETKRDLKEFQKGVHNVLQKIAMKKRYEKIDAPFYGDVYIYRPSVVVVKRSGSNAPRMRVIIEEVGEGQDLKEMKMTIVELSKGNILTDNNSQVFDLTDKDNRDAFKMIVMEDPKYREEVEFIDTICERLEKYNSVRDRITKRNDNTYGIKPPTPQEIRERRENQRNKDNKEPQEELKEVVEQAFEEQDEEVVMSDAAL